MTSEYPSNPNENKAVLKRTGYTISAKHCLWFAWAPANFPGPKGEIDSESRPLFDAKPMGATRVKVKVANPAQRWGHNNDPGRASGANGLDGSQGTPNDSRGLEMQEYKSPGFLSEHIIALPTHLNKLIMILEKDGVAPTVAKPGTQEILGEEASYDAGMDVTGIFIGMHDGHEWKNNTGTIDVDVTWS